MSKKVLYAEKYKFLLLFKLAITRKVEIVYLVDCVDHFPNHTNKKSIFERIGSVIFPRVSINRVPLKNESEDVIWEANQICLEFADHYENLIKSSRWGEYFKKIIGTDMVFLAFKKQILPEVFQKVIYYLLLKKLVNSNIKVSKAIPTSCDHYDLKEYLDTTEIDNLEWKISLYVNKIVSTSIFFISSVTSPLIFKDIVKKGIRITTPKKLEYDLGIHAAWGFPTEELVNHEKIKRISGLSDAQILTSNIIDPKKTLFIKYIWNFSKKVEDSFRSVVLQLSANEAHEVKNKIPVRFFVTEYLWRAVLLVNSNAIVAYFLDPLMNSRVLLHSHRLLSLYLNHEIFCQYYTVKVFFSRDDYDVAHIIRTIVQNKHNMINTGLQHSAFLYPKQLPFSAYTYFDVYYTMGQGFKSLWSPYWNQNKQVLAVGTHREEMIIDAINNRKVKDLYMDKYLDKITVLFLISPIGDRYSPRELIAEKYRGLHEMFDMDERLHLIIRPRSKKAVKQFFTLFPEMKYFMDRGRVTVELEDFTTQELLSCVNIFVAEDSSSSFLESLVVDDLLSIFFMVRYGEFDRQKGLVVYNAKELKHFIKIYLDSGIELEQMRRRRQKIKKNFICAPVGMTWMRIAHSINEELERM